MLATMTLEEKVGQLFVAELVALYTHEDHPAYRYALTMIHRYHVGSFLLAGGTALDIAVVTNRLQRASRIPLLINADLEAGLTPMAPWRRSRGWTERLPAIIVSGGTLFPSQMAIGATGNEQNAYELGFVTAKEARATGIHWSNSPVADVNSNPDNPIINTRSYGEDPAMVARMVAAYVRGASDGRMISTVKHFPGHGDTREDTHMGLPALPFTLARLDSVELVPFRAGINAGAGAVMTAHIALPSIDPTGVPATLSRRIMTGILRQHLGFDGIITTDALRMQGITDHFSPAEAAIAAIEAGVDCILVSADLGAAFDGLCTAVRNGRISGERLDASVRRILAAKEWVGLPAQRTVAIDAMFTIVGSPRFQSLAGNISDASVTLLRNERNILPLRPDTRLSIVTVGDQPGTGIDLLQTVSPSVASAVLLHISNETGREQVARVRQELEKTDVIVAAVYVSVAAWKGVNSFSEPLQDFLEHLAQLPKPVILVAFGDPYLIARMPVVAAILTPFGGSTLAEISIGRALTGQIRVSGRLPVTIPGRFPAGAGMTIEPTR